MQTINLNQNAEVILTQRGANAANEMEIKWFNTLMQYEHYKKNPPELKQYKAGDVYKDQLWRVFQVFGNSVELGYESPFYLNEVKVI